MKNIDNDMALGDISRWSVSLSMLLKRSILDSIIEEYAKYRDILNIDADNSPVRKDIEKAAPYVNLFQMNLCLKNISVIVEPSSGMRYIREKTNDCCT